MLSDTHPHICFHANSHAYGCDGTRMQAGSLSGSEKEGAGGKERRKRRRIWIGGALAQPLGPAYNSSDNAWTRLALLFTT